MGRSYMDHILNLIQFKWKKAATNGEIHLLFFDLMKDYVTDYVNKLGGTHVEFSINHISNETALPLLLSMKSN